MVLKNNTGFKLILGLGNKDTKSAIETALLYAKAGVRFFDGAPEIMPEFRRRLLKSGYDLKDFTLCVSVPSLGDIHGRCAHIAPDVCSGCSLCSKNCPQGAIFQDKKSKKYFVDDKKCIGCGICKKVTRCYAISFEYSNFELNVLKNLVENGFEPDMVELHASISDKKQIEADFCDILSFFKGDMSVCINKKQFLKSEAAALLDKLKNIHIKSSPGAAFYVQADGASMNGGASDCASTLECIEFAKELEPYGFNLIISGGTNNNTPRMLKDSGVKAVIGFGTYARNIVTRASSSKEALNKAKELCMLVQDGASNV